MHGRLNVKNVYGKCKHLRHRKGIYLQNSKHVTLLTPKRGNENTDSVTGG